MRPLSKAEAEEFQGGSPDVLTLPLALSECPPAPHVPVSPPRVGAAAAKPAEAAAPAPSKDEAAAVLAAAAAAPPAKPAAARTAAPNGKVPSGPPSRVLRLANMVGPLTLRTPALHGTVAPFAGLAASWVPKRRSLALFSCDYLLQHPMW